MVARRGAFARVRAPRCTGKTSIRHPHARVVAAPPQIKEYKPTDATTNPSLVNAAARLPEYRHLVDEAVAFAKASGAAGREQMDLLIDKLFVSFGAEILKYVPGYVSTEVDARVSFDVAKSLSRAHRLIDMYAAVGVPKERVLIKLASTWEGIKAAEQLEKEGISCNLTLLFSFAQVGGRRGAVARRHRPHRPHQPRSAPVGPPPAGRRVRGRWLHSHLPLRRPHSRLVEDQHGEGVQRGRGPWREVRHAHLQLLQGEPRTRAIEWAAACARSALSPRAPRRPHSRALQKHGLRTIVMGASFRSVGEITELAGCDRLTIAPKLLESLAASKDAVTPKLSPAKAEQECTEERVHFDEAAFRWAMNEDAMATDKLSEGEGRRGPPGTGRPRRLGSTPLRAHATMATPPLPPHTHTHARTHAHMQASAISQPTSSSWRRSSPPCCRLECIVRACVRAHVAWRGGRERAPP